MKSIYVYSLRDVQEKILIEIETEGGQMVKASRARQDAKSASGNLEDAFAKLQPMIPALVATLKSFDAAGQNSEISFGIRLTSDGDALVTSGHDNTNFVITMRRS
jgi:hypothetical protein